MVDCDALEKRCGRNPFTGGSNPSPSAFNNLDNGCIPEWGGARVDDWGRLLSGFSANPGTRVRIPALPLFNQGRIVCSYHNTAF